MSEKLWFISENNEAIAVYDSREIAMEELYYRKEDEPTSAFKVYALTIADLANYPDEFELANEENYI